MLLGAKTTRIAAEINVQDEAEGREDTDVPTSALREMEPGFPGCPARTTRLLSFPLKPSFLFVSFLLCILLARGGWGVEVALSLALGSGAASELSTYNPSVPQCLGSRFCWHLSWGCSVICNALGDPSQSLPDGLWPELLENYH